MLPDRIGGVVFDRRLMQPRQFTKVVLEEIKARWLSRKTQIIPVEMVATIVALEAFSSRLFRADLFLFTDSEVVEATLVKGYSSREDMTSVSSRRSFGTAFARCNAECSSIVWLRTPTHRMLRCVMICRRVNAG